MGREMRTLILQNELEDLQYKYNIFVLEKQDAAPISGNSRWLVTMRAQRTTSDKYKPKCKIRLDKKKYMDTCIRKANFFFPRADLLRHFGKKLKVVWDMTEIKQTDKRSKGSVSD